LKLILSKSGQTAKTCDISSSTNRITGLNHIEQEWNQVAYIAVNSDATLAGLDLQGWTGHIYYGFNDATAGDEESYCAPLEVSAQKTDTGLTGRQARLTTAFTLAGIFNFMNADKASEKLTLESTDQRTVKTLLTAIANASLAPFTHCKNYTITFDSEDSLIDSYIPADYFYVAFNESRLDTFRKLLRTTKCKARIEDDGEIHVFNPTVTGTTYDYEYNDAVTNHNFFEKGVRERLVIPNKIIVSSPTSHVPGYTGNATDSASYDALGRYLTDHKYIRAVSDQQCTDIATAMIQHKQVDAEKGHGFAPMNCGQEVMDYIKITDSVASDTRVGNIGYLQRRYVPGKRFSMEFRFGALPDPMQIAIGVAEGELSGQAAWEVAKAYIDDLFEEFTEEGAYIEDLVVPTLHVTELLTIPPWD